MQSLATKMLRRIRAHGRGKWVFTPKDFLDLGNRASVVRVLSQLVKNDKIRRISRGLYDFPRISGILKRAAPPDIDLAVKAIARRDGIKIAPDGIVAANQLGLTNAVPAKNIYLTNGASKTLKIGNRTIQLQHPDKKIAQWLDRFGDSVVRALSWLGKSAAQDPHVTDVLRAKTPDRVKTDLMNGINTLPTWMRSIVRDICNNDSSVVA